MCHLLQEASRPSNLLLTPHSHFVTLWHTMLSPPGPLLQPNMVLFTCLIIGFLRSLSTECKCHEERILMALFNTSVTNFGNTFSHRVSTHVYESLKKKKTHGRGKGGHSKNTHVSMPCTSQSTGRVECLVTLSRSVLFCYNPSSAELLAKYNR